MLVDQPIPEPLSPIQRSTPEERVASFQKESTSIYKKYSVYDQNTGPGIRFGSKQPFVYITVGSSDFDKNITNADSQAVPIGSTALDVKRVVKFASSGTGVLYIGKQYLLQRQNAFNETRIYNPLSLISATAAKGSTGLIEKPVRFLPTTGGIGNFIGNSLLSLVGIQSKDIESAPEGTATGATISSYGTMTSNTMKKGLLRYESGDSGRNRFNTYFPDAGTDPTQNPTPSLGAAIGKALINKLKSFIPSTNPFGFGGGADNKWEIRPEYKGIIGAYESMYADKGGMLAIYNTPPNAGSSSSGFVDTVMGSLKAAILGTASAKPEPSIGAKARKVDMYHRYTPTLKYRFLTQGDITVVQGRANDDPRILNISIDKQIEKLKEPMSVAAAPQFRKSTERLKEVKVKTGPAQKETTFKTYNEIGVGKTTYTGATANNLLPRVTSRYTQDSQTKFDERMKAVQSWDENLLNIRSRPSTEKLTDIKDYNDPTRTYMPYSEIGKETFGKIANNKNSFLTYPTIDDPSKSKSGANIIGGYDKYNTLEPLSGDRGEEPTDLTYGVDQSKDLIFFYFYDLVNEKYIPFRATLNSISEANQVTWDPVEYLGRADKLYLYKGFERTLSFGFTVYANSLKELVPMWKRINYLVGLARPSKYTASESDNISSFMYPPMITFRMGDLYYDQPAVLTSVAVNIPDDAGMWETKRGKGNTGEYMYYNGFGSNKYVAYETPEQALQLPIKADISVNMNLMEKKRSETNNDHYNLSAADKL